VGVDLKASLSTWKYAHTLARATCVIRLWSRCHTIWMQNLNVNCWTIKC